MTDTPGEQPERQLAFLQELLTENAIIAGDIAAIDSHTFAIHGVIPVDGEVLMAEFQTYDEARIVLDKLAIENGGHASL